MIRWVCLGPIEAIEHQQVCCFLEASVGFLGTLELVYTSDHFAIRHTHCAPVHEFIGTASPWPASFASLGLVVALVAVIPFGSRNTSDLLALFRPGFFKK